MLENMLFNQELTSAQSVVRSALNVLVAYHEVQLKKFTSMVEGYNPAEMDELVNKYHQFLEMHASNEEAFVAFLQYLN